MDFGFNAQKFQSFEDGFADSIMINPSFFAVQVLEQSNQAFAGPVFYSTFCLSLAIICSMFRCLAYVLTSLPTDYDIIFAALLCLFFFILMTYLVIAMNMISQKIIDAKDDLVKHLRQKTVQDNNLVTLNGWLIPKKDGHEFAIASLETFQGFTGLGFFALSKALLTGILSNFATYLIILVQFKMTEVPGSD